MRWTCRYRSAPCSRKTTRTPHLCTKQRKGGAVLHLIEVVYTGTSFAHHVSFNYLNFFVSGYIFLPGRFRSLRFGFVQMLMDTLPSPSRQLFFLVCIVASGQHVRSSLRCAGLIAPCSVVCVVDARRKHARIHVYPGPQEQTF